jgi:class 3 adenylate cyclase/tetratricopeptide (TPR) repeat protein
MGGGPVRTRLASGVTVCPDCGYENPADAKFCSECGTRLAVSSPASAVEERKVVSVLFCDLVGFTAASEDADPEDVRARLRPYHRRLRTEIEGYGGTVEKFVGDAVMAVFGAPLTHEDDAERAVRAGLRILEAIGELNAADPHLELQVRVGINTGVAVVARRARPELGEGFVTGDVVNTASRIEAAAPVNGVAVSESTYRATSRLFAYEPLERVLVKGKAAPLSLWQAKAVPASVSRQTVREYATPLVGRELERPLLLGIFERGAQRRSVQLVTIVGEAGVGKSRLCAELSLHVSERPSFTRVLRGHALPYGEGTTFSALAEIVKAEAGILETDSAEAAALKLEGSVSPEAVERQWLLERLRPLVGLGAAPPGERRELFAAWRRFVEALAADPTILVFEDLHWADEGLLDFLEYLGEWSQGVPLLVVCTARPELYERRPAWGAGQRNAHTINLSPLSAQETATLVSHLVGSAGLSPEVAHPIVARVEGNPLYAEEFVRLLSDGATSEGAVLPDSVHALIAARLDTLLPERKSLLQDAAVLGEIFWAGAVAEMSGRHPEEVELALHELARKELVHPAQTSSMADETEYAFSHALVREVAYSQIARTERARCHAAAAMWIERKAGERVEDLAEVLAHHCLRALEFAEAAGDGAQLELLRAQARRFLALAGERALRLEVGKAESYYRRALELVARDAPERATILAKSAEAAALAGRYAEAETSFAEAITVLKANGDNRLAGEALVRLSIIVRDGGDATRARSLLGEAVDLLEREPPSLELVFAYTHLARYYHFTWPPEECFAWADKAIAVAGALGIEERAMRARVFRGYMRFEAGDAGGIQELEEALRIGLDLGEGEDTAGVYLALGDLVWWSKGSAQGLDCYRQGIAFTERREMTYYTMYLKGESVWPLFDLGEWDVLLQTATGIFDWDRMSYQALLVLPYVARVQLFRGDVAGARETRDELAARTPADPQVLIPALAISAMIDVELGDHRGALVSIEQIEQATRGRPVRRGQHIADAVRVCVATGALNLAEILLDSTEASAARQQHAVSTARAVLTEAQGRVEDAATMYEHVSTRWAEYGSLLEQGRALLGAGRCLTALGRGEHGAPSLTAAHSIFSALAARPLLAEAESLLAGIGPASRTPRG